MGELAMKNKKYNEAFKEKVVKEAIEVGNMAVVARKFGISSSAVRKWMVASEQETPMDKMRNKAVGDRKGELLTNFKEESKIEEQNLKLKKLIGDKELEIEILRELLKKKNVPLPPR
jgi:transposase-like protein